MSRILMKFTHKALFIIFQIIIQLSTLLMYNSAHKLDQDENLV